ncbi:MAG: proline dehydrogenase family protein [Bacteroidales bacterium]|nr:proline dehydrogenase family protein [Bacteroidales bacterium]MCF8337447.1 proline dehydrogenase family protein [Bacteroidales bacterium]
MFNKLIAAILPYMPKSFVWLFSKKYIAGKTLDDAIHVSKNLNDKGILVTLDLLGEFIKNLDEAEANKNAYLEIIDTAEKNNIKGTYSIKPTFFGLLIDKETCYQYLKEVINKAASYRNFIRIDMEDSSCIDLEIELFRRLKQEFPKNVGLVFQAYMKRTLDDIKNLTDLNTKEQPLNIRLCKGIYTEPAEIAYKGYKNINKHFIEQMDFLLKNGFYTAIATHDRPLIDKAYELIEKYEVPKDMYEFQMLYGVTPNLRQEIINKGHKMRVYVPYGEKWFGYSTRRLKENPKMASHIIKALFIKK